MYGTQTPCDGRLDLVLDLDVVQIGLEVDERDVALGLEARSNQEDDGAGIGRRQRHGRRNGLPQIVVGLAGAAGVCAFATGPHSIATARNGRIRCKIFTLLDLRRGRRGLRP